MLGALKERLRSLLAPEENGPAGREVAVAAFALVETDAALCRKLFMGEELAMGCDAHGAPAVLRRAKTVGKVPEADCGHMARLLDQGASLSCRVVKLGQDGVVRVRVSIVL